MGIKSNPFAAKISQLAVSIKPQSITNTTINGSAWTRPWLYGRTLVIIAAGGAFAATVNGQLKIQLQKVSDDSWVNATEADGSTVLEFTPTLLDDATGALENGVAMGSIDLSDIDGDTYKAIRPVFVESGNAAALFCVTGFVTDLYEHPSTTTDELFSALHDPV